MSTVVTGNNLVRALEEATSLIKEHGDVRWGNTGILLARAEYTPSDAFENPMTFNPVVKVLDYAGQPTGETIELDHIIDMYATDIKAGMPPEGSVVVLPNPPNPPIPTQWPGPTPGWTQPTPIPSPTPLPTPTPVP